ncbi:MAG TPA: hypothetical protein VLV25_12650 [Steroidobacteraceae bacterium]|nr:hypothetical protein [Steroidobacteraceae bacterium]
MGIAHDEAIARHGRERRVEHELHVPGVACFEPRRLERHGVGEAMGSAEMDVQWRPGLESRLRCREQLEAHIEAGARHEQARIGDPVAARDVARLETHQIQRAALTGAALVGGLILRMDAAHARRAAGGHHRQHVPGAHATGKHRAGHDRAVARETEYPIDRETEQAAVGTPHGRGRRL